MMRGGKKMQKQATIHPKVPNRPKLEGVSLVRTELTANLSDKLNMLLDTICNLCYLFKYEENFIK
jgi:hypothetical protein